MTLQRLRSLVWGGISSKLLLLPVFFVIALAGCGNNGSTPSPVEPPIEPPVDPVDPEFPDYTIIELEVGDDLEERTLEALITAEPKSIIVLPAGTFDFVGELSVSVDNIVLRGTGMGADGGTVLNFAGQTVGSQSILATGDNFVVEDLAVEDSPGDAIKVKGSNGVTIRRVRVEWTNGPDTDNGAYGLYPVQTRNVLIEDSDVSGASDAGVYVGQSEVIIVRRNFVHENVAGIEIENSKFADVYDNETTRNTGGILVFDLPGPPVQGGEATRVFNNNIYENNTPNFAPEGNIVGTVPTGTGIMVMANDDNEIFGNRIVDNQSVAVLVVSYYIVDVNVSKPSYDPVPEKLYIHNNEISGNSYDPQGQAALISDVVFGGDMVDIFYDSSGVGTDQGLLVEFPDGLTEDQFICGVDNGADTTYGQVNASVLLAALPYDPDISTDPERFNCRHASLPPIELEPPVDPDDPGNSLDPEVLCAAEGEGINTEALVVDCQMLSSYRLFADASDATQNPNSGGIEYDLTTPLFTDYALKHRFVFVPEGRPGAYRSLAAMDFPVGTVISKTFAVSADLRDPDSAEEVIETRLMIRRSEGWQALPYIWNADKSDAELSVTGGSTPVSWIDAQGQERSTDYIIPNSNQCANCHGEAKLGLIGPKARLLNKDFDYGSGPENQLEHWAEQGILTGVPDDTDSIDTIPLWGDTDAPLDDRARGYLDINCAHCHSPAGAADTSGLFLEYPRPFGFDVGECKPPVAAGDGAGDFDFAIVPGDSAMSIMRFRMDSNELDIRMPEIGRSIIHTESVDLITQWIDAMEADDCL